MDWLFGRAAVGLGRAGPAGVAHAHEQHVSVDEVLAASPQITISNGLITARIAPPDLRKGFYRGTRFDQAGVVTRLTFNSGRRCLCKPMCTMQRNCGSQNPNENRTKVHIKTRDLFAVQDMSCFHAVSFLRKVSLRSLSSGAIQLRFSGTGFQ
jgi:hypothetical protein